MKNDRIRQFRLTSGAEVLCEVLQWDDENTSEVVVRHIYEIDKYDHIQKGVRIYSIKPYLSFQYGEEQVSSLNSDQIIITALPSAEIIEQYKVSILNNAQEDQERVEDEELNDLLSDRVEKIKKYLDGLDLDLDDSEGDNILMFPGMDKNKFH